VESGNKLVSQIRKSLSCERRRAGLEDNWTIFLAQIMACCNSHAGQARQSISNYEAVFGLKYHTGIRCPLSDMRECKNISERLRSPDERLQTLVDEMDIVDGIDENVYAKMAAGDASEFDIDEDPDVLDDITDKDLRLYDESLNCSDAEERLFQQRQFDSDSRLEGGVIGDDDSQFEGGVTGDDEGPTRVTSDYGDLEGGVETASDDAEAKTDYDSKHTSNTVVAEEVVADVDITALSSDEDGKQGQEQERTTFLSSPVDYTVQTAFRCGVATSHRPLSSNGRNEYKFVYPRLTCHCCHLGEQLLEVGDEDYNQSIQHSTCWWDQEFVTAFTSVAAHFAHSWEERDTTIVQPKLVHIITAQNEVHMSACRPIDDSVEKIVGIIHRSSHYAVLEIETKNRIARIYDGLGVAPLLNWSQHFVNALEKCQLVHGRATQSIIGDPPVLGQHPRTRNKSTEVVDYSITLDNQEWRFERGSFVAQIDG
jgi:hypothetical protein